MTTTIRHADELTFLANELHLTEKDAAELIINRLEDIGICTSCHMGDTIKDIAYCADLTVSDVVSVLNGNTPSVKSKHIDRLLNLVVIGDGDCPCCGAELEVVDGCYKSSGDGWLDPIEYKHVWEEKKCPNCDYHYSNEQTYD